MRRLCFALGLVLAVTACATSPVVLQDERAMAQEVFELSGGLEDMKTMARFAAPLALERVGDVGAQCKERMGRDSNPLGRMACDMVGEAMKSVRLTGDEAARGIDEMIVRLEGRAVQAMVDTYDAGELAAMRRYYASPEGRAIVAKRSDYLARLFGGK